MTKLVKLNFKHNESTWLEDGSKAVEFLKARGWTVFATREAPGEKRHIDIHLPIESDSEVTAVTPVTAERVFIDEKLVPLNAALAQGSIDKLLDAGFDTYSSVIDVSDDDLFRVVKLSKAEIRKIRRILPREVEEAEKAEEPE